ETDAPGTENRYQWRHPDPGGHGQASTACGWRHAGARGLQDTLSARQCRSTVIPGYRGHSLAGRGRSRITALHSGRMRLRYPTEAYNPAYPRVIPGTTGRQTLASSLE